MTVARVVRVLLAVFDRQYVEEITARWLDKGTAEWADGDLVWTEAQKKQGGTIRW